MKASSRKDFAYAMTPLKVLSWPVGTWPLQDYDIFSTMRAGISVFILLIMLVLVYTEIYLDSSNAGNNLDALVVGTCGILAVSKVICFRFWPEGLVSNFVSAVKDYNGLNVEENRKIMRRHARMGRVACASVILTSYFSATLFATVSILVEDVEKKANVTQEDVPNYPIPCEKTLAIMHVPGNLYLLIFVVQYLMLIVTSNGNLGSDSLFFGITFHLCGQVELLKMEFGKLTEQKEKTREYFNSLTKRHIYLFELAEMLNETISTIMVVQLFSSCLLICTSGFQFILAIKVANVVMVTKTFIVLSTLLVQLYAYSYVGDYLKCQMEGIGHSAYTCPWYELPQHVERDMIYVVTRSQCPVHLTAGKFFIVNMETYMSIVKTSMSYLSVLRVMVNA